jgi:hypothetical protein
MVFLGTWQKINNCNRLQDKFNMSFYGYICVYSKSTTPFDFVCFRDILKVIGPRNSSIYESFRSLIASEEWKDVLRCYELENHFINGTMTPEMEEEYRYYPREYEAETLPSTVSFKESIKHYAEGRELTITISDTSLGDFIEKSLVQNIPETLSGDFGAGNVSLHIGNHDICEAMSAETAQLFVRTFFSLRIGGGGCPNDWDQMREEIAKLPEIKKLCHDISQIIGPVGVCSFWNG